MVQDYVLLARVKGMSELRLVIGEALRNAVVPTLALTGVQFTFLIGGTVIVERIFSYPGIGIMAIDAVINRDLPLIQGLVLVFGGCSSWSIWRSISRWSRSIRGCAMADAALSRPLSARRRRAVEIARALLGAAEGGVRRRLHPVADPARRCSRRWIAPHDPLAQDLMSGTLPPVGFARPRSGLPARHRRSRPRHAVAADLRHPHRARPSPLSPPRWPPSSAPCSGCSPAIYRRRRPTPRSRAWSRSGWRFRPCCCRSCWSPSWAPASPR